MYEKIVSAIAQYLIYVLPVLALGIWLWLPTKSKFTVAWCGVIAAVIGLTIAHLAGALYYNPRPFESGGVEAFFYHEADNGFPSTHTLVAVLMAGAIFVAARKLGAVLLVMAVAIGICRALAHVHSWIDIIAAILIAMVALLLARQVVSRLPKKIFYVGMKQND